ncbi:MAG: hypothetical protein H6745_32855 [Deltaproteobacteria bacterium]|nr:hypothetical protein [Deltaproteobacteria bacterium]
MHRPATSSLEKALATCALAATLALGAAACDDAAGTTSDDEAAEAVLPGKADNYLSPTSQEYSLWGLGAESLDAADEALTHDEKEAKVRELLALRFKAYAHFINQYVADKDSHDSNRGYGGFAGLVRGSTLEFVVDPVDDAELEWAFIWELEMGGPADIMKRLPITTGADGDSTFLVQLPKLDAAALRSESYPESFDPTKYDAADLDELEVHITPEERSNDGWPLYAELAKDGVVDVLIEIGGDYNDARYDQQSAEKHFKWLVDAGFSHTAKAVSELTLESAPFTKTIDMNGAKVEVRVQLLFPDIVPDAELDRLRAAVIAGYETKDVVIYDGHAGLDPDYSGVVYHYNPRRAISATDLAKLDLPEKYQIFWFNGCKTYGAYPEAVYKAANKDYANLDVVSTVNFSWLSQQTFTTSGFLTELLALDQKKHDPRTWTEILTRVNQRANYNVYYGVHGIDDNPHLNPYADPASLCRTCSSNNDCPGSGNLCVSLGKSGKRCAAECTADDGCPGGYTCADIAVGGRITGHQCLPVGYSCP